MSYVNRIGPSYYASYSGPAKDAGVSDMVEVLAKLVTNFEDESVHENTKEETISIHQETHRWLICHLLDRGVADREFQEAIDYLRNRIGDLRKMYWKKFLHRVFMKRSMIVTSQETAINDKMDLYQRIYQSFRFAMRSSMNGEDTEYDSIE